MEHAVTAYRIKCVELGQRPTVTKQTWVEGERKRRKEVAGESKAQTITAKAKRKQNKSKTNAK
eukprot:7813522-Pyramimonas_sp.AAC.1